ncbi:hypothetical protein H4696_003598 [Amycolatopsis lexingtonensis]|uniref:Tetratricopeptide repeat protein n=1 Tax=Amycolatopsis lexingtonensis TaxID=218822 RepID=A0ABR9HZY8_9PSEU|nr:hypothetical protein [Amycolatopsis lexingtonensis]MBE1496498.1 hypothetical protein [Amycolatopsis lexingtonensis]
MQARLDELLLSCGFVLLTGDSTAGKSRAAYEAIRRLFPDHVLVVPASRDSLPTALQTALDQRRCVVWLDDLERFLGPAGLTVSMVRRLAGGGDRRVVVATLRSAEFDRYSAREEPVLSGLDRESWRAARDALELAHVVEIRRKWSAAELDRAHEHADDPRIRGALAHVAHFGLAEMLAAGPELAKDWRNAWRAGAHPRGAALVAAGVDCRRAGHHEPVSLDLLIELSTHYLEAQGGPLLRPEPVDEALAWATTPSHGTSSLLLPCGISNHFIAFDYLVDLPGADRVPRATWDVLIDRATPDVVDAIGESASRRFMVDAAVAAYRKAADYGIANADWKWASAIGATGDNGTAVRMLEQIVGRREQSNDPDIAGTLRARYFLALNTASSGNLARAVELYTALVADQEQILGPRHRDTLDARHERTDHLMTLGDHSAALAEFTVLLKEQQLALGVDDPDTLMTRHCMATCIGDAGSPRRAAALLSDLVGDRERILGIDDPRVFQTRGGLANFTARAGDPERAAEMYRRLACDVERTLGVDRSNAWVFVHRYSEAQCIAQAGKKELAKVLLNKMVDEWRRLLDSEGSDAEIARLLLCNTGFYGQRDRSIPIRRQSLEIELNFKQLLGGSHKVTQEIIKFLHGDQSRLGAEAG